MNNELLFLCSMVLYFGAVLVAYRLFGKTGLFVWSAIGVIIANIEVLKMVTMFGMSVTLGNVLYASTFIVTDILSENHSQADAQKAVNIGLFVTIFWVLATQLMLAFTPNNLDFIQPSFQALFSFMPRLAFAGVFTYAVVQRLDVKLYHWWWRWSEQRFGDHDRFIWLRNNGSTLISQFVDTILFTFIAFYQVLPTSELWPLIVTSYTLKAAVGLFDTPLIYLAKKWYQQGKIPGSEAELAAQAQQKQGHTTSVPSV